MAYTTATATADVDGSPHLLSSERLDGGSSIMDEDHMEPDMPNTQHMQYVDGRCSCCPYGYHIDLDFLRYCELSNGNYLRNLKKIERNKRKLRKSMEVFIQQQQREDDTQMSGPPPDVVNSTDNFMHIVDYEDSATSNILEEIDTSVNATLSSIDGLMVQKKGDYPSRYPQKGRHPHSGRYPESEYDTDTSSSRYNGYPDNQYRTQTELMLHQPSGHYMQKSDSLTSLSSQSSHSSDFSMTGVPPGSKIRETKTTKTIHHFVAAPPQQQQQQPIQYSVRPGQLALEEPAPPPVPPAPISPVCLTPVSSTPDVNDNVDVSSHVSQESLQVMRDQMAVSLQRLRELEEQVKAIPVLQVRISVLKEEKRLQALQLQAKNSRLNMRSIGVGDKFIDEVDAPPKPPTRTIGFGDGNVHEDQLSMYSAGTQPVSTRERELHSQENTHIVEKQQEIHTMMMSNSMGGVRGPPRKYEAPPKVPTRHIGVGEGNVFDASSNVHVHAKETRTFIVGGEQENKKKDGRNVGITCKPTLRDVGVMHKHEEEITPTRSIGVGVGEGYLIYSSEGELIEGFPTHTTVHNTKQTLSQLNMAAFHTRNINIKQEDLKYIVNTMLKREVHSKGIQVTTATVDECIQHEGYQMVSVSCGDNNSTEVEVRPIVRTRSVAAEIRPSMVHRSCITDKVYTRDEGNNTVKEKTFERATATVPIITYPAATNTVVARQSSVNTETDMKIFQALDQVKNQACNTNRVTTYERGVCTEDQQKILGQHGFDLDIRFQDKGVNTTNAKYTTNKAVNTVPPRCINVGVGNTDIRKSVGCDTCTAKDSVQKETIIKSEYSTQLSRPAERSTERLNRSSDKLNRSSERLSRSGDRLDRSKEEIHSTKDTSVTKTSPGSPSTAHRSFTNRTSYEAAKSPPTNRREVTTTTTTRYGSGKSAEQSTVSPQKNESSTTTTTTSRFSSSGRYGSSTDDQSTTGVGATPKSPPSTRRSPTSLSHSTGHRSTHSTQQTTETLGSSEFGAGFGSGGPKVKITREVHSTVRKGQSAPVENRSRSVEYANMGDMMSMEDNMRKMLEGKAPTQQLDMAAMLGQEQEFSSAKHQLESSATHLSRSQSGATHGSSRRSGDHHRSQASEHVIDTPESTIQFEKGAGGTQMRVIQHTETSYVGGQQVNRASNLQLDPEESPTGSGSTRKTSPTAREYKPQISGFDKGRFGVSSPPPQIEKIVSGKHLVSAEEVTRDEGPVSVPGKSVSMTETRIESQRSGTRGKISTTTGQIERSYTSTGGERTYTSSEEKSIRSRKSPDLQVQASNGSLKSIMKQPGEESPKVKRGISFAESVQGGYLSASDSDTSLTDDSDHDAQHRGDVEQHGHDDPGSDSDGSEQSYDEGSYDGRKGEIVYTGRDNETVSGAKQDEMYDHGIRETYELPEELTSACDTLALWLNDSTQVTSKELTASKALIQQEWFKISSHKLSEEAQVEDYLSSFKEFSPALLQNVVNMTDANANTGLHYAVSHCNIDVVNLLLDSGVCDVNKQNKAGYTACMLASLAQIQSNEQLQVIKKLFSSGDVNARASQASQTALMLAVSHGRAENVQLLLEAGADINMKDEDGSTALMCASEHGHTDIVKLLLGQPECNVSMEDNDGSTALSIAMEAGHRDVGVLLYAHLNFKPGMSPVLQRSRSKKKPPMSPSSVRK